MKFMICFLLLVGFTGSAQQPIKDKIVSLQAAYDKAVEKKDSVYLNSLFHDDMIITGGDGTRRNKKAEISDCVDPRYNVVYFTTKNIEVSVFGTNSAILRGDLEWQVKNNDGNPVTINRRITFTYVLLNEQWKIIAQHIGMPPRARSN